MPEKTRQQEIDTIWQNNRWLWFLPGMAVGLLIGLPIRLGDEPASWFIDGIWPETLGILFTVFLIDRLNRRRDEARYMQQLKDDLLRRVRSPENTVAKHAVHELEERRWLRGDNGLLVGAKLSSANLKEAHLLGANLQGADLWGANLQGVGLEEANLQGADLEEAKFDADTLLPDLTNWSPATDMARFTNPDRPDFWRSDDPYSPAYRGDDAE